MAGIKGRSGPRKGVPQKHGGDVVRLPIGEMPATMRRQLQGVRRYRRELESLVRDAKGEVNSTDAHLVNEACTAEAHAAVCRWLLRTRLEKMSVGDVAKCSSEILKAKTTRNRAVERLGLDHDAADDVLTVLYARPALPAPAKEGEADVSN